MKNPIRLLPKDKMLKRWQKIYLAVAWPLSLFALVIAVHNL